MIRIPTHRPPTHPGEMLLEEFLTPMGLSQRELAKALHVPYQRINEIINGRRGVTPSTALRVGKIPWNVRRLLGEPAIALGFCITRGSRSAGGDSSSHRRVTEQPHGGRYPGFRVTEGPAIKRREPL